MKEIISTLITIGQLVTSTPSKENNFKPKTAPAGVTIKKIIINKLK